MRYSQIEKITQILILWFQITHHVDLCSTLLPSSLPFSVSHCITVFLASMPQTQFFLFSVFCSVCLFVCLFLSSLVVTLTFVTPIFQVLLSRHLFTIRTSCICLSFYVLYSWTREIRDSNSYNWKWKFKIICIITHSRLCLLWPLSGQ
jgi:hypothetical protein